MVCDTERGLEELDALHDAFTELAASLSPEVLQVYSTVDWLRITSSQRDHESIMLSAYTTLAAGLFRLGHTRQAWRQWGYIGERIGSLAHGIRADGHCLDASGSMGQSLYGQLQGVGRCSRLDLAVTVQFREDNANEAKRLANEMALYRQSGFWRGRPFKLRLVSSFGGGDTAYTGSRHSPVFGRAYDKGREKPDEYQIGTWRYELELKDEQADYAYHMLQRVPNLQDAITSIVRNWMLAHGATLPFFAGSAVCLPSVVPSKTDNQKALEWLRRQVRPTVQRLLGDDFSEEVVEALFVVDQDD